MSFENNDLLSKKNDKVREQNGNLNQQLEVDRRWKIFY